VKRHIWTRRVLMLMMGFLSLAAVLVAPHPSQAAERPQIARQGCLRAAHRHVHQYRFFLRCEHRWFLRCEASVPAAITCTFPSWAQSKARRVSWCESRWRTWASNGQYKGAWQMGLRERKTYGHGPDPLGQTQAAYRYWSVAGWGPWECA
jgi:hypothetical protein